MKKFLTREKGQGLAEYALILVLVAIVVIAILLLLGPVVGNVFSKVVTVIKQTEAAGGGPTTFSVTSISIDNVTYTGTFWLVFWWRSGVQVNWSASCKDSNNQPVSCSVTAGCVLDNPFGFPDRNYLGSSPCWPSGTTGIILSPITVQVDDASASGYTWDGNTPSASSSVP